MFVLRHGLPNFESGTFGGDIKRGRTVGLVLLDDLARGVLERDPQWRLPNANDQCSTAQRELLGGIFNLKVGSLARKSIRQYGE